MACAWCGDGPLLAGDLAAGDARAAAAVQGGGGGGVAAGRAGVPGLCRRRAHAMNRLEPELRATVVARLREQRMTGELRSADVRAIAAQLGIGECTVWRWLATPVDSPRRRRRDRYQITEADRDAYADWRGNIAAVHRALHAGSRKAHRCGACKSPSPVT